MHSADVDGEESDASSSSSSATSVDTDANTDKERLPPQPSYAVHIVSGVIHGDHPPIASGRRVSRSCVRPAPLV
eukprot:6481763-Amphidinium_carterae.3